jgi:hypothetical protein
MELFPWTEGPFQVFGEKLDLACVLQVSVHFLKETNSSR